MAKIILLEISRKIYRENVFELLFERNNITGRRALICRARNDIDINQNVMDRFILKAKYPEKFLTSLRELNGIAKKLQPKIFRKSKKINRLLL